MSLGTFFLNVVAYGRALEQCAAKKKAQQDGHGKIAVVPCKTCLSKAVARVGIAVGGSGLGSGG